MAKISYPTHGLIGEYLGNVYRVKLSLEDSINILGMEKEAHPKEDKSGYYILDDVKVSELTGVDIPILLENDNNINRGIIAIVAQDPKRSDGDKQLPKDNNGKTIKDKIIVGTPFAFHYKSDAYSKTKVYRNIVDGLLKDGYKVYITDAHKIYSEDKTFSVDKDSEMDLLKDELSSFEDLKCVVTFGEDALNYIEDAYKTDDNKPSCVNVLHPSSNNTSNWDSWIFEQAYWEVKNNCEGVWSKYAQERGYRDKVYGKFKGNRSLEDVIVNSTIEKIQKCCTFAL